ncbi:YadA family autotransporter adhesin [Burkholderia ambifaria]|uniref:YadA family autotransporter adhesin n=1 Tax=Burkholderia ambifaria TaxID=152480 RepID=UPI0015882E84|nr:YadA family autotransporter adhesin [Burkholderia ambifaria]WDR90121.1 YadA family autotransporter adhesin [Burkholderia ambifaria]WDS02964.1 YadA family autotransporter adhesin [Burkholderia ambifaria]
MIRLFFTPSGKPSLLGSTQWQFARAARLSTLAVSLAALAPGYAHAGDLVLDQLIVNSGSGGDTTATGAGSIAIGVGARANGETGNDYSAIAIGAHAVADGHATVAVGEQASVHGDRSSAFGVSSKVNANRALALGADAVVTAHGAVALGQGSAADRDNTVSIGKAGSERQLVNLRAGTRDTDATNLSQLKPVVNALGGDAALNPDGSVRGPSYKIDGQTFTNVGGALTNLDGRVSTVETDVKSIRYDVNDLGTRLDNGTTGLVRQDPASLAISIGADKGGTSVSIAGANGTRTLTGLSNGVGDTDAVTIAQLKATGLVGPDGQSLSALVYDDLSLGRATLGGVGGTLLDNVRPGAIVAGGMQAVNGGQLFTMQQQFDDRFSSFDTRLSNIEKNGPSISPPGGDQGKQLEQLGDASGATGSDSIALGKGSTASGNDSLAIGNNASASGTNSVALGNNSVADRDNTVSVGAPGQERQITNVKAGTAPTDAVNVQQLNDQIGSVRNDIDHYRRDASGGIASAVAIANLPQASLAGESMVAIAGGTYSGQSAVAFGVSTATRNGRWVVKASGSTNTRGTVAVGAGAGYRW